jgi:CBS domain-containing protein
VTGAAAPEVTRFLREYPPFDVLDPAEVERVAATAEVEFHLAGTTIFSQGAEPVTHLRVVRSGAVEIVYHGRVLDLLGPGELFGQASMLSGFPTGFEARAAEDTLCYRIEAEPARELLAAPEGLRFVARSLIETWAEAARPASAATNDPLHRPVGELIHGQAVLCTPDTTVRQAAERMGAAPTTSVLVDLTDGSLGILTDQDIRRRVVAAGLSGDAPVSAVMSAPAYTCGPERLGGEVMLEMLDRGFRHFPVVSATGQILGVVEPMDIVAADMRSSFYLRQAISRADSLDGLVSAAGELRPMIIAMHGAGLAAANIASVHAVVVDALTRRLLELTVAELGPLSTDFAWLALGSLARRELLPSSDVDSALAWFGDPPEAEIRPYLHTVAKRVVAALGACGLRPDAHGASADHLLFIRSVSSWQRAVRSWIADPSQEKALLLVSVLVDSRPVWGVHAGTPVADTFRLAPSNPALLRLLARFALSHRPPTGFLRGLVVEHGGEHRGRLDLKHGGVIPIVDLARWAGMAAGVTSGSTTERLRAAGSAGTLSPAAAHSLEDAFTLITSLRLTHQVEQLRAGAEPDDFVNPAALSGLTRTYLKDAFRAVASIQKGVAAELDVLAR